MLTKCVLGIALLLLGTSAPASTDPFVGKWKLEVHRSKYPKGTSPAKMLIEMRQTGHGVWYNSDATYGNGAAVHA